MPVSRLYAEHTGEKETGARLLLRQMGAMLRKNYLLKQADWRQTVAEVRILFVFRTPPTIA